jgi:hypothetical protein
MLSGDGAVDGIGLRRGGCKGVVLRPPGVAASGHPGDADGIGHLGGRELSRRATAGVSPSIVWIELAWFGGDGCSVTRRSVRRRGNRSGVAELVPAGCSLWPPRLLGVGGGLVALVGGAVALVGGAVAVALVGGPVALVGGPVALVGDPVAHVRGPLTGVGDMVTVISGPVAFIGELLSLVGGRSRAARSS